MGQQYGKGDTEACIILEGDTSFQPIKTEFCPNVMKTNNMARCRLRLAVPRLLHWI